MSIVKTWQIESTSSKNTFKLAGSLGQKCKGGEIFVLVGDIGGGKTTFTKGLAKGAGSIDQVGSPTFTVSRVYSASNSLSIHHFDFYRLADPGIVSLELQEILHDNSAIIVIEWGEMIESVLPQKKLIVTFVRTGENTRQLTISYPKELSYVLEDDVK